MERLNQGHLHPILEHLETNMFSSWKAGIEPGSPAAHASTLAKSYANGLYYFRNFVICRPEPLEWIHVHILPWSSLLTISQSLSSEEEENSPWIIRLFPPWSRISTLTYVTEILNVFITSYGRAIFFLYISGRKIVPFLRLSVCTKRVFSYLSSRS